MLENLKKEANIDFTENGAVTPASSGSCCLDLFATVGALRNASKSEILTRFMRAFAEDRDTAMKILFFARDIRGGLGERRVFRVILQYLAKAEAESVKKNISYIAEYGRYDDLISLLGTKCEAAAIALINEQLQSDLLALDCGEGVSLLGKWLPSPNTSSLESVRAAKRISKLLGLSEREYRKTLTKLRAAIRIIENNLRVGDFTFDYETQPSQALFKYRAAFLRYDEVRYGRFLALVEKGKAKLNTSTLLPYQIVEPFFSNSVCPDKVRHSMDVSWRSLEDFTGEENALVVVDGSGSMYCSYNPTPAAVALSLAIYFAERNRGCFKNHFITFSEKPQLVEIKGKDIYEKLHFCESYNEVANTDIQKVFELVLRAAKRGKLPPEDMPEKIYIISDMEFDACAEGAEMSNFEYAKALFERNGYRLPSLVFWNVASRSRHQPVSQNEQGVALVSGCSPAIFKMLTSGELSPLAVMNDIIGSERYARIKA